MESRFNYDPALRLYLPLYLLDSGALFGRDAYGKVPTVTGAIWTPLGYSFDGSDDQLSLTTPSELEMGSEFTLECLIRPNVIQQGGLMGKWSSVQYLLGIVNATGQVQLQTSPDGAAVNSFATDDVVALGHWYHIIGVKRGTEGAIYINNVLSKTGTLDETPNAANGNFQVGRWGGFGFFYSGVMAYARAFARCFTPQEVSAAYHEAKRRF